jgi:aryl-alcohol dehydrogenase (NADP+)
MNKTVEFSKIIFGGNVFGWTVDTRTSLSLLDYSLEKGIHTIDTADMYSTWVDGHQGGESESVIGRWLKKTPSNRDKITLISKVGAPMGENQQGLSKKYIKKAVDASLMRLNTDYLDVYLSHYPDENTPIDETLSAYAELIQEGKIIKVGASNYSAMQLLQAIEVSKAQNLPQYEIFQPGYSLVEREQYETEYREICINNKLDVITYFSLAAGFLSGKYRERSQIINSKRQRQLERYFNKKGLNILQALDQLKQKYDAESSEIALAWAMEQPSITSPIASATSIKQIDSLAKAMHLKLDKTDIQMLTDFSQY